MPEWICPYKHGTLVKLYVQPGARSSEIMGVHAGRLKVKIGAPPRDGEANEEIVSFLAKILGVPKKEVEILRGESGRSKDIFLNLPLEKSLILLQQQL